MNLKGEKGDTGDQGEKGVKGDKGEAGEQGTQGAQGAAGTNGSNGTTGIAYVVRDGSGQDLGYSSGFESGSIVTIFTNDTWGSFELNSGKIANDDLFFFSINGSSYSFDDTSKIYYTLASCSGVAYTWPDGPGKGIEYIYKNHVYPVNKGSVEWQWPTNYGSSATSVSYLSEAVWNSTENYFTCTNSSRSYATAGGLYYSFSTATSLSTISGGVSSYPLSSPLSLAK